MTLRTARWLVVVVPAALYLFSWFHRVAPAVVAGDLMRALGITAATLGALAAIYPWVFAAMALVAGSLADTLGPRWTLTLGAAAMGAGAVVFGLAPGFAVAAVGRLLVSLGGSVMLIAWLSLAARWFRPNEFAMVSGLTQTVGNLGALIAAAPLALMVDAMGWRWSFVAIGLLTGSLAGLALAWVRDAPEGWRLPPVNPEVPSVRAARWSEVLRSVPGVVANPRTWPPVLAAGGVYVTLITLLGLWGVPWLVQVHGRTRVEAAHLTSWLAVGMGLGAPLMGWVSDRWLGRRRLPMGASATVFALCWVPLAAPEVVALPAAWLAPWFFGMGLASSGLVLVWSCVREVNDPARVGVAVGFCNVPIFLGFALLQWATGAVLDSRWAGAVREGVRVYPPDAYEAVFRLCLGIALGAAAASWLVTETGCRNIWRARVAEPRAMPRAR